MTSLTVSRAKDRAIMADRVAELARALGAVVVIEDAPFGDIAPRMTMVRIETPRGLCVSVDLDGDCGQQRRGVWVLSWHMRTDVDTCLDDSFGGDVNPFHFRKATYIAEGFEGLHGLLGMLELGLCKARDGDAFNDEREAASIAKRGCTAAEEAARWRARLAEQRQEAAA